MKYQLTMIFNTLEELESEIAKLVGAKEPSVAAEEPRMPAPEPQTIVSESGFITQQPDASSLFNDRPSTEEELDSQGFPWDARIHSSSKNKLKKTNAWKYIRGIDQSTIDTVEEELRNKGYGAENALFGEPQAPAPEPQAPAPEPQAPAPEPQAPAPEPQAPVSGQKTFNDILSFITLNQLDVLKITPDVNDVFGVSPIGQLAKADPSMTHMVYEHIVSNKDRFAK